MPRLLRRPVTTVRAIVVVCLALAGATGCGKDTPSSPSTGLAVAGRWTGTLTDRSAGIGQITVSIAGTSTTGTGDFEATFPDATVAGLLLADTQDTPTIALTLNVTASARDCPGVPGVFYRARLALTGNRMTGTYDPAIGCPLLAGGVIELTRR